MSIDALMADLTQRTTAQRICEELFPAGKRIGDRFVIGDLAGNPGQSLSVWLGGAKPGNWRDFAAEDDVRGDILDLIARAMCGGDKRAAIEWARRFLGYDSLMPDEIRQRQVRAKDLQKKRQSADQAADEKRRKMAQRIWLQESVPEIAATPVAAYLAGRGIDLSMVPSTGALRFHPDCLFYDTGEIMPAMVAAIVNHKGRFLGCHRTYLQVSPDGRVTKADVENPKRVLGRFAGGFVSICKGRSGKSLRDMPAGDRVMLTEGIEDALTLAMALPEWRILACVSLSNMGAVQLPDGRDGIGDLVLFRDNDTHPQAIKAFDQVRFKLAERFPFLKVARPPAGAKDANELIMPKREGVA